ncbi:type II toxin-antitoxin system VapC family toxin [Thermodesulfobacteriota bacterium]
MKIVLDAWALLALIFKEEPAAGKVKDIFDEKENAKPSIHMSWINLGEVFYKIARRKNLNVANEVLNDIKMLPIRLHEPSKNDILESAVIKSKYLVSYADAFAVSLAQKMEAVIFTGDPEIISLKDVVNVQRLSRSH